jgi:hypothetical protein
MPDLLKIYQKYKGGVLTRSSRKNTDVAKAVSQIKPVSQPVPQLTINQTKKRKEQKKEKIIQQKLAAESEREIEKSNIETEVERIRKEQLALEEAEIKNAEKLKILSRKAKAAEQKRIRQEELALEAAAVPIAPIEEEEDRGFISRHPSTKSTFFKNTLPVSTTYHIGFSTMIDNFRKDCNVNLINDFDGRCRLYIAIMNELLNDRECLSDVYELMRDNNNYLKYNELPEKCHNFLKKYPINNDPMIYNDDMNVSFKEFTFYDILKNKSTLDNLQSELKTQYDNAIMKIVFNQCKTILDGYDIIHDVVGRGIYLNKLKTYDRYFNDSITGIKCNNEHIRQKRNFKVLELKQKLEEGVPSLRSLKIDIDSKGDNLIDVGLVLSEEGGYLSFFNEIAQIWNIQSRPPLNDIKPFSYRESGRGLSFDKLYNYYKRHSDFETKCQSTIINKEFLELFKNYIPSNKLNLEIEKQPISTFDACKQTIDYKIMNGKMSQTTFKYVYGKYDYNVLSLIEKVHSYQIVVVTQPDNNSPIAIFCIKGDVPINFLINENNKIISNNILKKYRKGEAKNVSFVKDKSNIDDLLGKIGIEVNDTIKSIYEKGYYFDDRMDSDEKQLLLLGNKTIGDLIFSSDIYKTPDKKDRIYSLSTIDSLLWASVFYNYLSGNSNILQSVWQKDNNDGWTYCEGKYSNSIESQIEYLLIQIASVFSFIRYYIEIYKIKGNEYQILINAIKNILINIFVIGDEDIIISITSFILHKMPFNRIHNCLHYIYNFKNINIDVTSKNISDSSYQIFSYKILEKEIEYKKTLIDGYIADISKLSTSENVIDKLKSLPKLSNMLYVNTISNYDNDKKKVLLPLDKINKNANIHFYIFNVYSNLDKVIKKKQLNIESRRGDVKQSSEMIDFPILNKDYSTKINLWLNNDDQPNIFKNKVTNNVDGYFIDERESDINKLFEIDELYPGKKIIIQRVFNQFVSDYLIKIDNELLDGNAYYKLINNTLNYSKLEIIIFTNKVVDLNSIKSIGQFNFVSRAEGSYFIGIYILRIDNNIGNLFELLNLNSIQHDKISTRVILTKILTHFKFIFKKYILESSIDDHIVNIISEDENLKNIILNNLKKIIPIKNNEIDKKIREANETVFKTPDSVEAMTLKTELDSEKNDYENALVSLSSHPPVISDIVKKMIIYFYLIIENQTVIVDNTGDEEDDVEDENVEDENALLPEETVGGKKKVTGKVRSFKRISIKKTKKTRKNKKK